MTPDEIRADCDAGTPGPWRALDDADYTWKKRVVSPDGDAELGNWHIAFVTGQANARRIARLPDLEDAYLALTDRVAQLKKALKFYADPAGTGYDVIVTHPECYLETGEIIGDEGRIARAALTGETL